MCMAICETSSMFELATFTKKEGEREVLGI